MTVAFRVPYKCTYVDVVDWQVAGYRRAMAAQTIKLAKLTRKHRELSGLSEFYRCLYSDWDMFMTQFYDPDHLDVESKRFSETGNANRWIQRGSGRKESNSGRQQSASAAHTTNSDNVVARCQRRATVSNQQATGSVKRVLATNATTITTRAMSEAPQLSPVLDAQTADAERTSEKSVAEDVTMTTHRRSRRLRCAVAATDAQALMDGDVKPVLDEPIKPTLRSGRKKPAVHDSGQMESVNEDVKPFAGLSVKIRRIGRAKLDRNTGNSLSATLCVRRRRGKRDASEASADVDVKSADVVTAKKRRGRRGTCGVSHVGDNDENDDVKPVVSSVEGKRGRKAKQARLSADGLMTGAKNTVVEVVGEIACIKSEEQDVKPDLSTLDVVVASTDPTVKPSGDVAAKRRRGRSRKFGVSSEGKNIKRASGTMERKRKCRKPKQSTMCADRSASTKNSVEVDREPSWTRLEKEDVKPELTSLEVAAVVKRGRRSKRRWSGSPAVVTRSMYRVKQLPAAAAAAADSKRASPARCAKSPPFTPLSPSQIKREVES